MRILFTIQCILFLLGISYAFRISHFLDPFVSNDVNEERQSDVTDQILPIFLIAFTASLINSLLFMNIGIASVDSGSSTGKILTIAKIRH